MAVLNACKVTELLPLSAMADEIVVGWLLKFWMTNSLPTEPGRIVPPWIVTAAASALPRSMPPVVIAFVPVSDNVVGVPLPPSNRRLLIVAAELAVSVPVPVTSILAFAANGPLAEKAV